MKLHWACVQKSHSFYSWNVCLETNINPVIIRKTNSGSTEKNVFCCLHFMWIQAMQYWGIYLLDALDFGWKNNPWYISQGYKCPRPSWIENVISWRKKMFMLLSHLVQKRFYKWLSKRIIFQIVWYYPILMMFKSLLVTATIESPVAWHQTQGLHVAWNWTLSSAHSSFMHCYAGPGIFSSNQSISILLHFCVLQRLIGFLAIT